MSLGGTFQDLGQLFDYWESEHWTIDHVGRDGGVTISGGQVRTDVELRLPLEALLELGIEQTTTSESITVDGDGALECTIRAPLVPDDVGSNGPRIETTEVRTTDDRSLVVSMSISLDCETDPQEADGATRGPASESDERDESDAGSAEGEDPEPVNERQTNREEMTDVAPDGDRIRRHQPDVPAFEDTAYLREVYETYDTFAEMADEVDMDVTAETIRRYMIDAGVHEPTRYNTGSESDESDASPGTGGHQSEDGEAHEPATVGTADGSGEDAPVVIADGIGLPEGLSADEFIEIVKNSRTLYEVQKEMGVERTTARDILKEYNLMEFVMGQLAFESELYVTREEVVDRIRESVSA